MLKSLIRVSIGWTFSRVSSAFCAAASRGVTLLHICLVVYLKCMLTTKIKHNCEAGMDKVRRTGRMLLFNQFIRLTCCFLRFDPEVRISTFLLKSINSPRLHGITFQEILLFIKKWIFFNLHNGGWNQGPLDTAAT
jgi:NADH:ubiquinone oxidoreductase subunit 3 (subunit A)